MLSELSTLLISQAAFGLLGWQYARRFLSGDDRSSAAAVLPSSSLSSLAPSGLNLNWRQLRGHLLFALTFGLSLTLFELIIFEIMGVMSQDSRRRLWNYTLATCSAMLVAVLPLAFASALTGAWSAAQDRGLRFAAALAIWLVFLVALWRLDPRGSLFDLWTVEGSVSRIGIIGVASIAVLSGSGSIYTPYQYLHYFVEKIDTKNLAMLERQLELSRKHTEQERSKLESLRLRANASPNRDKPGGFASWFSSGSGEQRQADDIELNIGTSETMEAQMAATLEDLRAARAREERAFTLWGRFLNVMGYFFSAYCIFKVITSSINVLFQLARKTDPVTRFMQVVVAGLGLRVDVELWSQQISFLFVGMIMVASTRNLLLKMSYFSRFFSSTGSAYELVTIVLAQLTGMYFTSMVILMRMSLPMQYRQIITDVLSGLEFNFYYNWFDKIFLLSAGICVAALYVNRQISSARYLQEAP